MGYFLRSRPTAGVKPLLPKASFNFKALLKQTLMATTATIASEGAKEEMPVAIQSLVPVQEMAWRQPLIPTSSTPPTLQPSIPNILQTPTSSLPANPHKRKAKSASMCSKKRKFEKEASKGPGDSHATHAQVLSHGVAVEVDLDASKFEAARGAHTTRLRGGVAKAVHSGGTACSGFFEHIAWDGKTPIPVLDQSGCIIAVLAGQPRSDYEQDLLEAFKLFSDAGKEVGLGAMAVGGGFPTFNVGVSMGMGSPVPVALNPGFMVGILNCLVGTKAMLCMAAYQNVTAAFFLWAPRVYDQYKNMRNALRDKLPHLPDNFPGLSEFAAAAFNLGGNVWTFKHRDRCIY
ncbi:hypothetical protein EV359DRAFT_68898 [Lentinula novae-zelandiae]|nr:hypothetical protein EV359DRAFT_68898 [Lentinula novae-zelandiae]